ncbi:MAG TPA: SIS domain-containing protein [Candidatus Limnocylindrales bacterium]
MSGLGTAAGREAAGREVAGHEAAERLADLRADGPDEMGRELAEGPAAVDGTLAAVEESRPEIDRLVAAATRIVMVGTGASLSMARVAAPSWLRAGLTVLVRQSTEAALGADGETFRGDDAVVAISQSGGSPETLSATRRARRAGCRVLTLTADGSSALAALGDVAIVTPSGREAGAATKSELSALAALFAIGKALPADARSRSAIRDTLDAAVADWAAAAAFGPTLAASGRTWLVGLGMGAGIAGAAGLLWHEKVHQLAFPTTVSEFRHGPVEAATADDVVVLFDVDPAAEARERYLELLRGELERLGTRLVEVSPRPGAPAGLRIASPPGPEAALEALLRVQQLARATAHAAGRYVDGFRVLRAIVGAAPPLD